MKAIRTRYFGPTDTKGSRIIADDLDGNRITVSFDHGSRDPHFDAAEALCHKMGWEGPLVGGGLGRGVEVFVWAHDAPRTVSPVARILRAALKAS